MKSYVVSQGVQVVAESFEEAAEKARAQIMLGEEGDFLVTEVDTKSNPPAMRDTRDIRLPAKQVTPHG